MVEKIKVIYQKGVEDYLDELVFALHENDYFGFVEDAISYTVRIISAIDKEIHLKHSREVPAMLADKGSSYVIFKDLSKNKRTSWIVFFHKHGNEYLITHITNNYGKDYALLGKLL